MRLGRSLLVTVLLVSSCAAPGPAPAAAPASQFRVLLATEGQGAGALEILSTETGKSRQLPVGTLSKDRSNLYAVSVDGAGRAELRVQDLATPGILRRGTISSARFDPLGIVSANGRWLALRFVEPGPVTHIGVFDTASLSERDVALEGDFGLDAIDAAGRLLYLLESVGRERYRVRDYDLAGGRLDADVIVDKSEASPVMSGIRVASVATRDGGMVFSLYRRAAEPLFIHVLWPAQKLAFCVDLPSTGALDTASDWSLLLDDSRARLYVLNPRGVAAEIDVGQFPRLLRTQIYLPPSGLGGWRPGLVTEAAAKAPYDLGTSARAALSKDGSAIFIPDGSGFVTLTTANLRPVRRSLPGRGLSSLFGAPGGRVLFAVEPASGDVLAVDAGSGTEIRSFPTRRPLAVLDVAVA